MTRSTVVGVIHKLTVDEFVDHTNTPTTSCGETFVVQNLENAQVTQGLTLTSYGQPIHQI